MDWIIVQRCWGKNRERWSLDKHVLSNPTLSLRPVRLRGKDLSDLSIPSWLSWSIHDHNLPTTVYCYDTTAFDQEGLCVIASLSLKHCGFVLTDVDGYCHVPFVYVTVLLDKVIHFLQRSRHT